MKPNQTPLHLFQAECLEDDFPDMRRQDALEAIQRMPEAPAKTREQRLEAFFEESGVLKF